MITGLSDLYQYCIVRQLLVTASSLMQGDLLQGSRGRYPRVDPRLRLLVLSLDNVGLCQDRTFYDNLHLWEQLPDCASKHTQR